MRVPVPLQRPLGAVAAGEDRRAIGELHQRPVDPLRQEDSLGELRPRVGQSISSHRGLQAHPLAGPFGENDFEKNAIKK